MPVPAATLKWMRADPLAHHISYLCDPIISEDERRRAKDELLALPSICALVREVAADPWPPLNSHRSAGHPLHKLEFLAELGLDGEELGLDEKLDRILGTTGEDGLLGLPIIIPRRYGGDDKEGISWGLCDSPILAYSLVKLGRGKDPRTVEAVRKLRGMAGPQGYRCITKMGFRGPGKKDDPCPYANLIMLKLLSVTDPGSEQAARSAEVILDLWDNSRTKHPYIFYMGTDFRKLKYPMVWYDILHVAEVLSRFDRFRKDPRLRDMVSAIAAQADAEGRFTPGAVWMAWKEWDFGQKKRPSPSLTAAVLNILRRLGEDERAEGRG